MKKSLSVIVLAFLVMLNLGVNRLYAQGKMPNANTSSGSTGLMFSLTGFGSFGTYGSSGNGSGDPRVAAGIGVRHYISDNIAMRGLLNLGFKSDGKDTAKKSTLIGFGLGAEYHFHQVYSIDIYVGGGVGYNSLNSTNPVTVESIGKKGTQTIQASSGGTEKDSYGSFAVTGLFGFDWYLWSGVAIGAEYSIGYASISSTHTASDGTATPMPTTSQFGISGGSNIHLIVNF